MIIVIFLLPGDGFAEDTVQSSGFANVTNVQFRGELWPDPVFRGGFVFETANLPLTDGVVIFVVRGNTEIYVNRLLATLLAAKNMNKRVKVGYIQHVSREGTVVSIKIE